MKIIDDILKGLPENARLRAQLGELRPQIEALESQLKDARSEIQRLKDKYESPTKRLPDEQLAILRVLESRDRNWTPEEVATTIGADVPRTHYFLTKLRKEKYIYEVPTGFQIEDKGREALHGS